MLEEIKLKFEDTSKHFATGSAYMIKFLTIAGFMNLFAKLFEGMPVADVFTQIGGYGMMMFVPILSGYIAFGIADRQALAAGLIGGLLAYNLGTGFIGGVITGFLCGYIVVILSCIKMPSVLRDFWTWMIPVFAIVIVGIFFNYLIAPPIAALMAILQSSLTQLLNISPILLGLVLGLLAGSDFGGPINKVGYMFSMALFTEGITEAMAMFMPACAVVSIGMGLATIMKPKLYSKDELENGKNALTLGLFMGFSEGAIPFALNDFKNVMLSSLAGAATTGTIAALFKLSCIGTGSGIIVGPMMTSNIVGYFVALIPGVLVCAFLVNFLKRNRVPIEEEDF